MSTGPANRFQLGCCTYFDKPRNLTLPSSGPPPAWPAPFLRFMFRCAGQAGGGALMSNVRPHRTRYVNGQEFSRHRQEQILARAWLHSLGKLAGRDGSERSPHWVERFLSASADRQEHEHQRPKLCRCTAGAGRPSAGGQLTGGCAWTGTSTSRPSPSPRSSRLAERGTHCRSAKRPAARCRRRSAAGASGSIRRAA
jgi:hypothetical protein